MQFLSGSLVQTSETTLEIGLSMYLNTIVTGCLPHATVAISADLAGNGVGTLLRFRADETFSATDVLVAPCSAPTVMSEEGSGGSSWRVAP